VKYDFITSPEYLEIAREILGEFHYRADTVGTIAIFDDNTEFQAVVLWTGYCPTDIEVHVASVSPKWATPKTIRLLCTYPFTELGVRRVSAQVDPDNTRSISLIERMGFKLEGEKRNYNEDGTSKMQYGMTKHECRWL